MEKEVYRAIVLSAQKYTYFLLTAAGAGIALAANQTQGEVLGWAQTPLAIAVICWCLSFFFGCRNVECDQSVLDVNSELLKAQSGKHPVSGIYPQQIKIVTEVLSDTMAERSNKAYFYGARQFRYLVAGAIFYIVWHTLEMYLRTVS